MKEISFLDWKILVDAEQTKLAYQSVIGATKSCDCDYCSNFVKIRDEIYPKDVLNLLEQCGIDHTKEADLYQQAIDKSENTVFHRWWFYFVGNIVEGKQAWKLAPKDEARKQSSHWEKHLLTLRDKPFSFLMGFSDDPNRRLQGEEQFVHQSLKPFNLVQVEFNANTSWILAKEFPRM